MRALALAISSALLCAPATAAPIARSAIRVIDGDTIAVGKLHYRLVGFDAPEIGRARCPVERALGLAARDRLREIVGNGRLDLTEVACACAAKTVGTHLCNYGRRCGVLTVAGRDVGAILIREGLAHPYPYDRRRAKAPGWCGR